MQRKTQRTFRLSGLTMRQIEEIGETFDMSQTEMLTLALDRLYRDLCTQDGDLMEAAGHFTAKVHALDETPVDQWQWTGEDMHQMEWLLNVLASRSA